MKQLWSKLVASAAAPLGLAAGPQRPKALPSAKPDPARVALVRTLAGKGLERVEIARQTGMSQDTVGMLLNLNPHAPADSAGRGTFFRILETRMAS